jgi:hypothetical protein
MDTKMKKIIIKTLSGVAFLVFSLAAQTAAAESYFISPSGNDISGTGSFSAPWKTLYKATQTVVSPGNVIEVLAGTYLETQQSALAVGVSIQGEGNASVIQGTMTAEFTTILALGSPVGTNGNQHISNLKFDGRNLTSWGAIKIEGRSNVSVYGTTVVDFLDTGVIFNGDERFVTVAPSIWATGNKFYNNVMTNCARYAGYGRGCLQIGGQDGMLIYGNSITQDQRTPGNNGWCIKGYSEGFLRNVKMYDNTLVRSIRPGESWDFAVELFNVQGGVEFYRNTVQGSFDTNYQSVKVSTYSLWIHDNTFSVPTPSSYYQNGIILEVDSDGVIIENNKFINLFNGVSIYPRAELVQNIMIRNNLFKNIGGDSAGHFIGGFESGLPTDAFSVKNFFVYNNTMVAYPTSSIYWGISMGTLVAGRTYDNVQIKNNIVQNVLSGWLRSGSFDKMINSNIQYNNAFGNGSNNEPNFEASLPLAASSVLSNNLKLDPRYVNTATYQLSASSPLIDAGTNVGYTFSGLAPDIGYVEYRRSNSVNRDLNGDGKSDLLRLSDDQVLGYIMNGVNIASSNVLIFSGGWTATHTADLNGDGKADILWRNTGGSVAAWLMNGLVSSADAVFMNPGAGWRITHTADLNGDGKADILWRHTDGRIAAWLMNGLTPTNGAVLMNAGAGWRITHAGDLNGDGKADILWQHTDGRVAAWTMNGLTPTNGAILMAAGTGWSVTHLSDLNADSKSDILWQHTDGRAATWLMNGLNATNGAVLMAAGSGWSITHTADLNGDGQADILWQHTDGRVAAWIMNGVTPTNGTVLMSAGTGWRITQIADFNGDENADIVWKHTDGQVAIWQMVGFSLTGVGVIFGAGPNQVLPMP